MHFWVETAHKLAAAGRKNCIWDFAAVLPFIQALGGDTAVWSVARSIAAVGAWWP
ncbi:MAG: hypothetical protein JOZ35_22525 [Hyphomicrobiales bacterium]|nr:hypothetical protein [Hyphomicrobiales bacterium]